MCVVAHTAWQTTWQQQIIANLSWNENDGCTTVVTHNRRENPLYTMFSFTLVVVLWSETHLNDKKRREEVQNERRHQFKKFPRRYASHCDGLYVVRSVCLMGGDNREHLERGQFRRNLCQPHTVVALPSSTANQHYFRLSTKHKHFRMHLD